MKSRFWAVLAVSAVAAFGLPHVAAAQPAVDNFPDRPIKIVVAWPAGGATDISARAVADKLSSSLGQPVIIENVAGATGAVGTAQVARSEPDGYTLLMATGTTNTLLPHMRDDLPFDGVEDFSGISQVIVFPNLLAVRPELPVNTVGELIELLKDNPDRYTFSSTGHGGSPHMSGEMFMLETDTRIRHIPFTGSAPALTALVGGHVDMMFDQLLSILPYVQDGTLRGLAVTSLERLPDHPDIPTISETIPGFEVIAWASLLAPAGTPDAIREKISNAMAELLADDEIQQRFQSLGAQPVSSTPAETDAFVRASYENWGRIVRDAGIVGN